MIVHLPLCLPDSISVDFIHACWGGVTECVCVYGFHIFERTPLQFQMLLLVTFLTLKLLCLAAE